jgi:hypothetical protein
MKKQSILINTWQHYNFNLKNRVLTFVGIKNVCADFTNNVLLNIPANETIMVQMKICLEDGTFKSVSIVELFTSAQSEKIFKFFCDHWAMKNEYYFQFKIHYVIISYKIIKNVGRKTNKLLNIPMKKIMSLNEPISSEGLIQSLNNSNFSFGGYNLPTTMDITLWGDCVFNKDYTRAIINKPNTNLKYEVFLFERILRVNLLNSSGEIVVSFQDSLINKNDLTYFSRLIKNQEYVFDNNNLVLKMIQRKCETIKPGIKRFYNSEKFLTMDIETLISYINNEQKLQTVEKVNTEKYQLLIPYCVSIYDGKTPKSFYLLEFLGKNKQITEEASQKLIEAALKSLMLRKYNGHKIYLHNFSYFDGIFMMKAITSIFPKVEPIIKDNQLIDVKVYFGELNNKNKYPYTLHFRDSFLLLPSSLEKLGKNFNVENKGYFPFEFVTDKINLDYKGPVPEFKYFPKINIEEYNNYCDEIQGTDTFYNPFDQSGQQEPYPWAENIQILKWNLRKETIKYCELDCKVLYQVISVFNKQIFQLFNLDVIDSPTLSSLAMKIYKTKFMGETKIPVILDSIYDDIKKAYTGGAVDVYKPYFGLNISNLKPKPTNEESNNESNLNNIYSKTFNLKEKYKGYYYDVNSLYPFVMKNNLMPVGDPVFFEGDILNAPFQDLNLINLNPYIQGKIEDSVGINPFGFFEVEVESPSQLDNPILQVKIKTDLGVTSTIAPLGSWKGWYFSEEIYNAMKYNYKFKVLKGYLFNKGNIFENYVNFLYNIKVNSKENTPNYTIAKLLLNSLYGKLGMNPIMLEHKIVDSNSKLYLDIITKNEIENIIDFKNGKELISFHKKNDFKQNLLDDNYKAGDKNKKSRKSKKSRFDVSIPISVAVTAYARIYMSKIKNIEGQTIYYSDTDSAIIDKPLPEKMVGKELGQFKLEYLFNEGIFLCPKVYGIKWEKNGEQFEHVKIKGVKKIIEDSK